MDETAVMETSLDDEGGGSTMSFHDLYYSVRVKDPHRICGTTTKEILKGISGIFKPGMNAIMGPTASGKTSLLDVLAGRKDKKGLWGNVLIDGKKQPHNFRNISGYVVQNDIVMSSMTVRENLMFSANLRLSAKVPMREKKNRVDQAIEELGLTECQDTRVGGELTRGVSGGERKRTNIGMELVVSSQLLFLDEPTTGLDANTAYSIMALLRGLSRNGRTIIFAIHQPRYSIFKLFDQLMLIDAGRTVYHGPAGDAIDFFTSIGYECEPHDNPADFFLDVIGGIYNGIPTLEAGHIEEKGPLPISELEVEDHVDDDKKQNGSHDNGSYTNGTKREETSKYLADKFEKSVWYKDGLKETLRYLKNRERDSPDNFLNPEHEYARSFPVQVMYLSKRTLINLYRFPLAALIQWTVLVFFAIVTGGVYYHLKKDFPSGVQNRVGAFFFLSMNVTFASMVVLELFINERAIFKHENISGYYRVSSYFVAKVFCDIIPMRVIPMIPVSLITYFMFGLEQDLYKVLFYTLAIVQTSCCGAAVGFLVSGRVNSVGLATLVTYLIFVVMMVFGGVLVNVSDMSPLFRWIQYLSIIAYCVKALTINELKDMKFCGDTTVAGFKVNICYKGKDWLELQGEKYETDWDVWQNQLGLFLLFWGLLTLSYIQLRRLNKLS